MNHGFIFVLQLDCMQALLKKDTTTLCLICKFMKNYVHFMPAWRGVHACRKIKALILTPDVVWNFFSDSKSSR